MVTNNKRTKINPWFFFLVPSKRRFVSWSTERLMHHALTCSNKTKSLNFSLDLDFKSIQQEWVALAGGQGAELGRRQDFCTALSDWFWQQTEMWSWMQNTPFPKVHSTSSARLGTPPWSPSVLGSRKHTKGVKNTKDSLEKVNILCLEKFRSCYNGQYNKSLWKQSVVHEALLHHHTCSGLLQNLNTLTNAEAV